MLLAAVGAKDDPSSGGRQMPSHWGAMALNIVSGSSATGMKVLHAVGAAEAGVIYDRVSAIPDRDTRYHGDEVVYVSLGDGTTSEGEFWEALERRLPEAPAGAVSRRRQRLRDFGSRRGPDRRRRHLATGPLVSRPARRVGRRHRFRRQLPGDCARPRPTFASRKGPALVHAHVTRPYSHSLSDDEKLYKTPAEREHEAAPRSDQTVRRFPARAGTSQPTPT